MLKDYLADVSEYLLYKKGDVIATVTTDRNGFAYVSGLPIGKYKVVETVAGDGFVLNREERFFEITPQEQTVCFDIQGVDYKNERQKLEIQVLKQDSIQKKFLLAQLMEYMQEKIIIQRLCIMQKMISGL